MLRDWEQGRTEPDQPARAYLTVIARDPEGVLRALQGAPIPWNEPAVAGGVCLAEKVGELDGMSG